MRPLLKIALSLGVFFTGMLLIFNLTGLITVDKIELWLESAKSVNPVFTFLIVFSLLFADLFIAVPTLTISLLAGHFLGPVYGAISVIAGLLAAGICGYAISRRYGDSLIKLIVKEEVKRVEAKETFRMHGPVVILLSRATPVLPELSACLAGMTGMKFTVFLFLWSLNCVPYAVLVTYAGSISSLQNPTPAILVALGLTILFGSSWLAFRRRMKAKVPQSI